MDRSQPSQCPAADPWRIWNPRSSSIALRWRSARSGPPPTAPSVERNREASVLARHRRLARGGLAVAGPRGRDLFPIDRNFLRGFDPDPDLVAVNLDDRHNDVITDDDLLAQLPAQNQHGYLPLWWCACCLFPRDG